jgi:hypothetical protein
MKARYAYGLSAVVAAVAFTAWAQGLRWNFGHITTYKLFPLLGLMAWSLLWSMYIVNFFKRRFGGKDQLKPYFQKLRLIVICLIVLHPGLLIWQLWRDGFGLPPGSYLDNYVAPAAKWAAILSSISFLVFVAYEFKRKFGNQSWWRYIEYLGDAAMIAIFIHSLKLGGNLQHGWFRWFWLFYGTSLIMVIAESYYRRARA